MLDTIKRMLSIEDNARDDLLQDLMNICKNLILLEINEVEIPNTLEWILIEVVIARYNKLSPEGFTSESIEGGSISFCEDILELYRPLLKKYMENKTNNLYGVSFIWD